MDFTREQYENLPARDIIRFKTFVLQRFGDYTKFTNVKASKHWHGEETVKVGVVEDPFKGGWSGWKVDAGSLFDDNVDYFIVHAYLEDERAPTMYYNYVRVPKAFVFGEMEQDAEYQEYLRLKAKFEGE